MPFHDRCASDLYRLQIFDKEGRLIVLPSSLCSSYATARLTRFGHDGKGHFDYDGGPKVSEKLWDRFDWQAQWRDATGPQTTLQGLPVQWRWTHGGDKLLFLMIYSYLDGAVGIADAAFVEFDVKKSVAAPPLALPAGEVARTIPGCKLPCGKPCVNSRFGTKCNVAADCCNPAEATFTNSEYGPVCHCHDKPAPVVHVASDPAACLAAMATACPGERGKGKACEACIQSHRDTLGRLCAHTGSGKKFCGAPPKAAAAFASPEDVPVDCTGVPGPGRYCTADQQCCTCFLPGPSGTEGVCLPKGALCCGKATCPTDVANAACCKWQTGLRMNYQCYDNTKYICDPNSGPEPIPSFMRGAARKLGSGLGPGRACQ